MRLLPIIAIIGSFAIATSATAQLITENPSFPKINVIKNGTRLRIYDDKIIQNISAESLQVRVLESSTCNGKKVNRQTLSGKIFLPQTIKLDKQTGNLAVGVLLQDCLKQNISAAFILQPNSNWSNYVINRVQVPGKNLINDKFSTYPLHRIKEIGFIDGNLLIKQADSINSEALLVFNSSNNPAGKYVGCIVTQQSTSNSICPSFD